MDSLCCIEERREWEVKGNHIWTTDRTSGEDLVIHTVSWKPRIFSDVSKRNCLDCKGLWEFFVTLRPGVLVHRTLEKGQKFYRSQFAYFYDILTEVLPRGRARGAISSYFGSPSINFLPTCGVRNAGSQNGRKTSPVRYRTINQGLSSYTHYLVYNLLSVRCHSTFSGEIICGLHRGSFAVQDHLRRCMYMT